VVVTDVYGTVINVQCKVLNPHGNDPLVKAEFTICFDPQENLEIVDVKLCQNM
jgi:ribosomal protein L35AE/L33A